MPNAKCRNCDNDADAGAYCSSCADHIMAKALNPFFGGKWKKGSLPELTKIRRAPAQQSLFRLQRQRYAV